MDEATREAVAAIMIYSVSLASGKGYTQCKKAVFKEIKEAFKEDPYVTVDKMLGIMDRARLAVMR